MVWFGMKLDKFVVDSRRRPFLENTLVLECKVKIRRLILSDDLFFFRDHYKLCKIPHCFNPGNNVKLARYCIGILLRYMHVLAQYCVIIICTLYGYWPSIVYTVHLISSRYSADTML